MANKKQPPRTVFDVAKPGKDGLPTSATTRPVIVTNRPVIKDPMVNDPQPSPQPSSSKKITITPLHDDVEPEKPQAAPKPEPQTDSTVAVNDKPVTVTPETTIADVAPPESLDPAGVPTTGEERDAESELAHKRAARLQKMIDEEEYFLPIKTVEERRSRKVAIFGILLIIILAAAWYDVALDAGLLPNTYNLPHTSFFTVQ